MRGSVGEKEMRDKLDLLTAWKGRTEGIGGVAMVWGNLRRVYLESLASRDGRRDVEL